MVPGTLQCLAIMLAGSLFGMRASVLGGLLYVLGGASGIPWFSGLDADMSTTGGYILGFVPALALVGHQADTNNLSSFTSALGTYLVALMVVYLGGTIWLVQCTGLSIEQAYIDGVQATFVGDIVGITVASAIAVMYNAFRQQQTR